MENINITYVHTISVEEYNALREAVGFRKIPENRAKTGLEHSTFIIAAKCGDATVGTARLISDGGYVAYIADVIVHPDYQGHGIGKAMIRLILSHIQEDVQEEESVMTCLMAAKGRETFYEQFGFISRPNDEYGAGMSQWINK